MKKIVVGFVLMFICASAAGAEEEAVNIGGRLELLVDDFLIEAMDGKTRLQLHRPERREIVLRTDEPWGGNASGYQSVFKDGDLYRMYYRTGHYRHSGPPAQALEDHPWFLCYAESDDGIHWCKPELGLFEFEGSTANNIIVTPELIAEIGGCPAHTATFKDANPDCPPAEKYKIITVGSKPRGLHVLVSADGIHFSLKSKEPFVTSGAFDSQNLVFWDSVRGEYREYHRDFRDGVRGIRTAVSPDLKQPFPEPQWLVYPDSPVMALYTNQIQPYYRAPHIFMGFPKRYNDRGWSEPMLALPELDERLARAKAHPRYGTTITDGVFMTSRDGLTFNRWSEAFLRPGPRKKDSWVYGDNFIFWGMVETESHLGHAPNELSLYAVEGYWEGICTDFRRLTMRVDGFVSAHAPYSGGEIVTKPVIFEGGNLTLNVETSAMGSIQVELQDAEGNPIEGYTLDDCPPIFCDDLCYVVRWDNGGDVRPLEGKPVRLRFVLKDADLYAFQFVPYSPDPERPDVAKLGGRMRLPPKSKDREPFVVLEDDFQSAEAGTSPTETDLDPIVGDGGSGWLIREGAPDRVQVLNDDPVGSGTSGSNHYMKIERREEHGTQGGRAWLRMAPQDAADTKNGVIEIQAKVYVPSTNRYCVDLDGFDGPPNEWWKRAFHLRLFPDGRAAYYQEEEHHDIPGVRFVPDTWVDVTLTARMKEAMFDVTIDGATAIDLPFATPDVHRIQTLVLCPNTNNCTMYIDDVHIRVVP